jgi:phytanoyl-CoA hydroxylase
MKTDLTLEQIEQYRRDGFLLIEEFLEPDELRVWREVTEDAVRQRLEERGGQGFLPGLNN